MQRPGRCGVTELLNRGCDPAPGIGTFVIAISRKLVDAGAASLKRFVAVALQHQGGSTPDIDFGYHAAENRTVAVDKGLTPMIALLAKPVTVATDGSDIDRGGGRPAHCRRVRLCRRAGRRRHPARTGSRDRAAIRRAIPTGAAAPASDSAVGNPSPALI